MARAEEVLEFAFSCLGPRLLHPEPRPRNRFRTSTVGLLLGSSRISAFNPAEAQLRAWISSKKMQHRQTPGSNLTNLTLFDSRGTGYCHCCDIPPLYAEKACEPSMNIKLKPRRKEPDPEKDSSAETDSEPPPSTASLWASSCLTLVLAVLDQCHRPCSPVNPNLKT